MARPTHPNIERLQAELDTRLRLVLDRSYQRRRYGVGDHGRPLGVRQLLYDWREGRRYGYPACCIAHFMWDGLIGWPSGVVRWDHIDYRRGGERCVPCGVFHAEDSPYPLWTRLWRILEFNGRHLLPTRASRARRLVARAGSTAWRSASMEFVARAQAHGEIERLYWDDGGLDPELEWDAN